LSGGGGTGLGAEELSRESVEGDCPALEEAFLTAGFHGEK